MDDPRAVHVNDAMLEGRAGGGSRRSSSAEPPDEPAAYRSVIFVTTSVFMGYASLVVMQHRLKGIHDRNVDDPTVDDSMWFKHAATLNYVGNLIFRIAHNFVFAPLSPRMRVHLALGSMAAAMGVLGLAMCIGRSPWIGWVFIAYFLGGVSVGTFESNLLACITPLGHGTKKWAIFGLPLGFNLVSVGGFLLMLAGAPLDVIYITVFVCCLASMALFQIRIPASIPAVGGGGSSVVPADGAGAPERAAERDVSDVALLKPEPRESYLRRFRADLVAWRSWMPKLWPHMTALMLDMYCVSFFASIMLYILNDSKRGGMVPLLGPNTTTWLVPHDAYFACYNMFTFLGDTLSRQLVYRAPRLINPIWYLSISFVGCATCLLKIPLIAPFGIFLVFFGNGAVYGTSTKFVDTHIERKRGLTALSLWLFIGDIGSVLGSNTWPYVAPLVCKNVHAPHMCLHRS